MYENAAVSNTMALPARSAQGSLEGTFVGQSSRMWEQRHRVNHPRMAHLQEHHHSGQLSGTATQDVSGTAERSTARGGVTSLWRWSLPPQEAHYSKAPFFLSLCLSLSLSSYLSFYIRLFLSLSLNFSFSSLAP